MKKKTKYLFELNLSIKDTSVNRKMEDGLINNKEDYKKIASEIIGDIFVNAWIMRKSGD